MESICEGEFQDTIEQDHHESNRSNACYRDIVTSANSDILIVGKRMV